MSDKPQREPTLEDARERIFAIENLARCVKRDTLDLHEILDQDIHGDLKAKVAEDVKDAIKATPNLRFDINRMANDIITILGDCREQIRGFKTKLRNDCKIAEDVNVE